MLSNRPVNLTADQAPVSSVQYISVARCVRAQVGKAASKGGSVADKAGSAVKDIKGKNPLGELDEP